MNVRIEDTCVSCGVCVDTCPEVFCNYQCPYLGKVMHTTTGKKEGENKHENSTTTKSSNKEFKLMQTIGPPALPV